MFWEVDQSRKGVDAVLCIKIEQKKVSNTKTGGREVVFTGIYNCLLVPIRGIAQGIQTFRYTYMNDCYLKIDFAVVVWVCMLLF